MCIDDDYKSLTISGKISGLLTTCLSPTINKPLIKTFLIIILNQSLTSSDYDWKSGRYSTWTESTWQQISARIFLRPSRTQEVTTLTIGIVVFILSFVLIFLIRNGSEVLFNDEQSRTEST